MMKGKLLKLSPALLFTLTIGSLLWLNSDSREEERNLKLHIPLCPGIADETSLQSARRALRDEVVHVVIMFDNTPGYRELLQGALSSMHRSSLDPRRVFIHLLALREDRVAAEVLAKRLELTQRWFDVDVGTPSVAHPAAPFAARGIEGRHTNDATVAHHFHVAEAFPDVEVAVMIDSDVAVLFPIEELWMEGAVALLHGRCETRDGEPMVVAAVSHRLKPVSSYFNSEAQENAAMDGDRMTFGNGVMVLHLAEWRRRDISRQLWGLLEEDDAFHRRYVQEHGLSEAYGGMESYRYRRGNQRMCGTRPFFNIFFYGSWFPLHHGWNVGPGCRFASLPPDTRIVHFAGPRKPSASSCSPAMKELWEVVASDPVGRSLLGEAE